MMARSLTPHQHYLAAHHPVRARNAPSVPSVLPRHSCQSRVGSVGFFAPVGSVWKFQPPVAAAPNRADRPGRDHPHRTSTGGTAAAAGMAPFAAEFGTPSHDFVVRTLSPRSPSCRVTLREALQREGAAGALVAGERHVSNSWMTDDLLTGIDDDPSSTSTISSPASASSFASEPSGASPLSSTSSPRDADWALIDDSFCMDLLFSPDCGDTAALQSAKLDCSRTKDVQATNPQFFLGSFRNVGASADVDRRSKENEFIISPVSTARSPSSSASSRDDHSSLSTAFPFIHCSDETLSPSYPVERLSHGLNGTCGADSACVSASELAELEQTEQRGKGVGDREWEGGGKVTVQDGRVYKEIVDEIRLGEGSVQAEAVFLSEFEARAPFVDFTLSEDAVRVASSPNAGGASVISESLSVEYFVRHFGASDIISEMEVQYCDSNWKKVDYICSLFGQRFGVSVTRAMMYPDPGRFDYDHAKALLRKKLHGLMVAWSGVSPMHCFSRAILHIWCETPHIATLLHQAFPSVCRELDLQEDVLIVLTVAEGNHGWPIFYESVYTHSIISHSADWSVPCETDKAALCTWVHMGKKHRCR